MSFFFGGGRGGVVGFRVFRGTKVFGLLGAWGVGLRSFGGIRV